MIRVALVGCGGIASKYRSVYARLPGVSWRVAVDIDDRRLDACRALGVPTVTKSFEAALQDDIDMVDISTPNDLHAPQALAAFKAGKHVFLQKPLANSLATADAIVAAARDSDRVAGVFMSSYTNPYIWEIKRIIQSGLLGNIQSVRARDAHRGGLTASRSDPRNWRANRKRTGGGSFLQLSIHAINLMQWWLGSQIVEATSFSANQYCPGIGGDDVTAAAMRFADGTLGIFDSGYASRGIIREIYGTRGHVRLCEDSQQLQLCAETTFDSPLINYSTPGVPLNIQMPAHRLDDIENPFNQHRQFVEVVQQQRDAFMSVESARHDIAVVDAVYESARTGRAVSPIAEPALASSQPVN